MKIQILDAEGTKVREKETQLFDEPIRIDIIRKVIEAERFWHPYAPKYLAGMNRSASGKVRHKRHSWKSDRGKGLARIPKKQMWRRGTQFSWEGAIVPSVRGGRRAHPPHGQVNNKKINKKEFRKAMLSSLHYITTIAEVQKKYGSLHNKKISLHLPLVLDSSFSQLSTKLFLQKLARIVGEFHTVAIQTKQLRAGKGKTRGRKNKTSSGLLFVVGKDETKMRKGIETIPVQNLEVSDFAENGARLTVFSEQAIDELEQKYLHENTEKIKNEDVREEKEMVVKPNKKMNKAKEREA
ncbi:MAG: 50S ribosomal protein L4 [Nanoarchaeota archaeon]